MGCRARVLINKKLYKNKTDLERSEILEEALKLYAVIEGRTLYQYNPNSEGELKEACKQYMFLEDYLEDVEDIIAILTDTEEKKDRVMQIITKKLEDIIIDMKLGRLSYLGKEIRIVSDCDNYDEEEYVRIGELIDKLDKMLLKG